MEVTHGKRDKQRINSVTHPLFIGNLNNLMRVLNLQYPSYRDLVTIYNNFKDLNTGITPSGIVKSFHGSDGSYRALQARLSVLQSKGLVQSVNGSYYPTEKTISLLGSV